MTDDSRARSVRNARRFTLAAVAALFAVLVALQLSSGGGLGEGAAAPEFSLPLAVGSGGPLSLESLRGKVVVLDFWSTTCPPCRSQAKVLETIQRRMGGRGVQVVGVSAGGESVAEVAEYLKRHGAEYPIGVDADGTVSNAYRVRSLPTVYVVDREGRIAASHVGYWPEDGLAEAIAEAIGDGTAP